jgi:hypothetical protein
MGGRGARVFGGSLLGPSSGSDAPAEADPASGSGRSAANEKPAMDIASTAVMSFIITVSRSPFTQPLRPYHSGIAAVIVFL